MSETGPQERDETRSERADRNFGELLEELRVALPGVQVLFAFLLIVPFNDRFVDLSDLGDGLYQGTLVCSALSAAFLIAPGMNHRLLFRRGDKEHLVEVANRLAIVGLTLMALAMVGVVGLVADLVMSSTVTTLALVVVALAFVVLWYVMPLMRLRALDRDRDGDGAAQRR